MHCEGLAHESAKKDAIAAIRCVLRQDWAGIKVILRHSECRTCLVEALAVWGMFTGADDDEIEECEHGCIALTAEATASLDEVLADLQGQLNAGS